VSFPFRRGPQCLRQLFASAMAAASTSGETRSPRPLPDACCSALVGTPCSRLANALKPVSSMHRRLMPRRRSARPPLCGSPQSQICRPTPSQQNSCYTSRCTTIHLLSLSAGRLEPCVPAYWQSFCCALMFDHLRRRGEQWTGRMLTRPLTGTPGSRCVLQCKL